MLNPHPTVSTRYHYHYVTLTIYTGQHGQVSKKLSIPLTYHISHYHTAGVPGRNEIDDTQELNYKGICKALKATGYKGFLGQEFRPKRDPLTSLKEAVDICTV